MVAGKVKAAMLFQKSPSTPKATDRPLPPRRSSSSPMPSNSNIPPSSNSKSSSNTVFSRSFGVYFPKSSAQVQPRPPDVTDLLKLVEDLKEKESRLKTELLEHKILKETASIVPFLEKELASRTSELDLCKQKIERLIEASNTKDERIKSLEAEIEELKKINESLSSSQRFQGLVDASSKSNLLKTLRKCSNPTYSSPNQEARQKIEIVDKIKDEEEVETTDQKKETSRPKAPRIPKPPPLPLKSLSSSSTSSSSSSSDEKSTASNRRSAVAAAPPPPPPPPPPAKGARVSVTCVRRVPEVVEFYHSMMRRGDSKRETGGGITDLPSAANARNMIGEIENRSAYLLAIKTDVETQGDFIQFLIKEVNNAAFTNIGDLVAFVKWLDDELSFLVDERAVLKHFDWPELKADAMREAAFGYRDLKKLELEALTFRDDRRQPCSSALKKMQALLEKLEHGVYNLSRVRESAMKKYRGFKIPWEWLLETGFACQIKLASVKLAMKYMKRVSSELESIAGGPEEEELMLQGVRFAFRVHQFAGGFDVETMRAFQELRDKSLSLQTQRHNQQKLLNRSMALSC